MYRSVGQKCLILPTKASAPLCGVNVKVLVKILICDCERKTVK